MTERRVYGEKKDYRINFVRGNDGIKRGYTGAGR